MLLTIRRWLRRRLRHSGSWLLSPWRPRRTAPRLRRRSRVVTGHEPLECRLALASFTFPQVYEGSPSSWSEEANELRSITEPFPVGSRFRFVSADPNAPFFSGNNVSGNLEVLRPNGTTDQIFGVVSRLFKANGKVQGMYFYVSGDGTIGNGATDPNEKAYAFVLTQSYFTAGSTYKTSSDPVDTALNAQLVPNSAPAAVNDSATTPEDTQVSGNVLTNDSDPNLDPITVTQFAVDTNGDGTAETFTAGATARTITGVGTISVATDGSYVFTPTANYSGSVPLITYTVTDGSLTSTATLAVTVTPTNDPPTSTNDTKAVNSGVKTLLATSDFGTFSDPDGDSLSAVKITALPTTGLLEYFNGVTWTSVTVNQVITAADITAGKLRFTAAASTTPSLSFQVSDGTAYSTSTYTLTFTVTTSTNQSPVASPDVNTVTVAVSSTATGNVRENDSDPDGATGDLVVKRASRGATLGAGGATIVTLPTGSSVDATGETGVYTNFTVTWANSSSTARPPAGTVLTLTRSGIPTGTTATIASSNSLTDTLLLDGLRLTSYTGVSFTWNDGSARSATRDMTGGTNVSNRVIAVTNAASALSVGMGVTGTGIPANTTITSIADDGTYRLVHLSQAFTGSVPTDVVFTTSTEGTITGLYGTLKLQANGNYTYTANGGVASGSVDVFTYEIADAGGATATTTLSITILQANAAPVNSLSGSLAVNQGGTLPITTLSVSDTNRNLTTVTVGVSSGTLDVTAIQASQVTGKGTSSVTITGTQDEINLMLSTLVYSTDSSFSGNATLTVTSTDAGSLQDVDTYSIGVTAAPTVTGTTVNEASSHVYFTVNGAVGQLVTLAVRAGTATLGDDYLGKLEYYDGSSWAAYTGAAVTIPASGSLFVRVPVVQDTANEGSETVLLDAINSNGIVKSGTSFIVDDGTGAIYTGAISGGALTTSSATKDDDRSFTVTGATVNEASPYAIFSIAGAVGQKVASLSLAAGTATSGSDFDPTITYYNGSAWVAFTAETAIPAGGTLLVRVPILNDGPINTGPYEGPEGFGLVASNTGGRGFTGTSGIADDGTGDVFLASNTSGVADSGQSLDRDSAVTVTALTPTVNEASPHAFFSVVGTAGVPLMLAMNDRTTQLNLSELQKAVIDYSSDGVNWTRYTYVEATGAGDKPTPSNDGSGKGTVYVRVGIANEQDSPAVYEGAESFELVATTIATAGSGTITQSASDTASVVDNGTGLVYEGNLSGGSPVGGATGADDDRPSVSIAVSPSSVAEGNGAETTTLDYTVTLANASAFATVVTLTLTGTATLTTDYTVSGLTATGTPGEYTLTIPAGQTTATFHVDPVGDTTVETNETVVATITSAVTNTTVSLTIATAVATGTITEDDSRNAPVFTNSSGSPVPSYTFSYVENRTTTTVLGQVYATDADGDTITFSITANVTNTAGDPLYAINASTGEITLTSAGVAAFTNDFELGLNTHQITVGASDGSSPVTTIGVTLTETNEDDNNPIFRDANGNTVQSYAFSYAENRTTSSILGQVRATDADGDTVTFSITSNVFDSNNDPLYAIDSSTGEITLTAAGVAAFTNDFEITGNTHQITVGASDGSTPLTTIGVTLNETNEDDSNPIFRDANGNTVQSYTFSYAENRTTSNVLGRVYATDADGDTVTFSITSNVFDSNNDPLYAIDSSTGEITLTAAGVAAFTNDFEVAGNTHQITVGASDGSAPVTTIGVTLTETNEDDNNPVFTDANRQAAVEDYQYVYAENRQTTDVIGHVYASDADGDAITFAITSNLLTRAGDAMYAVNPVTGAITLTAAGVRSLANDYELASNTHEIAVGAFDGAGQIVAIKVVFTETNLNDNQPIFTDANGQSVDQFVFEYPENRTTSDVLSTVYASDADGKVISPLRITRAASGVFDVVTFTIVRNVFDSAGNALFAVGELTGELRLTEAGVIAFTNDFEALSNTHEIVVAGSDGSGEPTLISVTLHELDEVEAGRAVDDVATAVEAGGVANSRGGKTATGNLLGNDTGAVRNSVVSIRVGDAAGQGVAGVIGQPLPGRFGTLTVQANGQFAYAPDNDNPAVDALPAGASLVDEFNYSRTTEHGTDAAVLRITIAGANDTPRLVADSIELEGIPANTALPEMPAGRVGLTIGEFRDARTRSAFVADVDDGSAIGFAITGADRSRGAWWYSLDDGATWQRVGAVSASQALLLPDTARLFYRPTRGVVGAVPSALSIRAWDQTSGTAGRIANVSAVADALSATTARLSLRVEVPGASLIDFDTMQRLSVAAPAGDLIIQHSRGGVRTVTDISANARVTTLGRGALRLINAAGDLTVARGGTGVVTVSRLASSATLFIESSFGMLGFSATGRLLTSVTPSQLMAIRRGIRISGTGSATTFTIQATL